MDTLVLKLVLTPALIGAASLAGRRWGPGVSGWLVGLPLTSGPIVFFLALSHGSAFAAAAAIGVLVGTLSQASFCVAYAWVGLRGSWPVAVLAGSAVYAVFTAALEPLVLAPVPLFLVGVATLAGALAAMPGISRTPAAAAGPPPRWDLPARMATATVFVLLLTGLAPALGPRLTGLLSPFPIYGGTLASFALHQAGPAAAARLLRGLLLGLFGFAAFFAILAGLLDRIGLLPAFGAATAVALLLQGAALWVLRRSGGG